MNSLPGSVPFERFTVRRNLGSFSPPLSRHAIRPRPRWNTLPLAGRDGEGGARPEIGASRTPSRPPPSRGRCPPVQIARSRAKLRHWISHNLCRAGEGALWDGACIAQKPAPKPVTALPDEPIHSPSPHRPENAGRKSSGCHRQRGTMPCGHNRRASEARTGPDAPRYPSCRLR